MFVAPHCDKQNFGLWHWAIATKIIFVCRTESLWQTKLVYATKKFPKATKNVIKKRKIRFKSHKKCQKEVKIPKKLSFVDTFGNFLAIYTNLFFCCDSVRQTIFLFVAAIQCNKLHFCFSQWLSATNNIDKKIIYLLVACDKDFFLKPKTNILPNLNFTSAIKLLWSTFDWAAQNNSLRKHSLLGKSGTKISKCCLKPPLSSNMIHFTWKTKSVPMD